MPEDKPKLRVLDLFSGIRSAASRLALNAQECKPWHFAK